MSFFWNQLVSEYTGSRTLLANKYITGTHVGYSVWNCQLVLVLFVWFIKTNRWGAKDFSLVMKIVVLLTDYGIILPGGSVLLSIHLSTSETVATNFEFPVIKIAQKRCVIITWWDFCTHMKERLYIITLWSFWFVSC